MKSIMGRIGRPLGMAPTVLSKMAKNDPMAKALLESVQGRASLAQRQKIVNEMALDVVATKLRKGAAKK